MLDCVKVFFLSFLHTKIAGTDGFGIKGKGVKKDGGNVLQFNVIGWLWVNHEEIKKETAVSGRFIVAMKRGGWVKKECEKGKLSSRCMKYSVILYVQ